MKTYEIIRSSTTELVDTIQIEPRDYSLIIKQYPGCYGIKVGGVPKTKKEKIILAGKKDPMGFLPAHPDYNHYFCCDGYTFGNPGLVGIRLCEFNGGWNLFADIPSESIHTNQFAELYGIYKLIKHIRIKYTVDYIKKHKFVIFSDNFVAIDWAKGQMPKMAHEKKALIKIIGECQALMYDDKDKLPIDICKWLTDKWDQIPADPGRK